MGEGENRKSGKSNRFIKDRCIGITRDSISFLRTSFRPRFLTNCVTVKCFVIFAENIIGQVANAGNVAGEDLRDRKTSHKVLRQIAMELSYRYSNAKQREIGAIFGVDYSTVSKSRARLKAKLKSSRKLKKQFHRIRDHILKMSNSKI